MSFLQAAWFFLIGVLLTGYAILDGFDLGVGIWHLFAKKDRDRRILFMRYADADAVEVYNDRQPRLGRLVRGTTRFDEVLQYEANLSLE